MQLILQRFYFIEFLFVAKVAFIHKTVCDYHSHLNVKSRQLTGILDKHDLVMIGWFL